MIKWLGKLGGKRWVSFVVVTLIFIFLVKPDRWTWGIYIGFTSAWAGLETKRKGGD